MIRFDRLKLIAPLDTIDHIDERVFQTIAKDGYITSYKYKQETPFYLLIRKDFHHNECVIEFTGKVLSDRYPELINKDSIHSCIEQINSLSICEIDADKLIQTSIVSKCDVTKDINSKQITDIISQVKQSLSNYDKWEVEKYSNGICLRNKVVTNRYKKRICIYDKGKEIMQQTNSAFIHSLKNSSALCEYFKDKVRFEINIGTMTQIRNLLKIEDNSLNNVLASTANPIFNVIDEALRKDSGHKQHTTFKDYVNSLILADCHNDLAEVEAKVRALSPKSTVIKRKMQPFIDFYNRVNITSVNVDIRSLIS